MEVVIFEKESGNVVANIPVLASGLSYESCLNLAWECAVDDDLVEINSRDKYEFKISN